MRLAECYSKYIRDNLNCTLPWDRRQQSKGKEKCESPEHYLAMKSLLRPFETMGERELREETGCLPPCSYFSYDSKRLKQSVFTAEMDAGAAMTKEEAWHLYTAHFHFKETSKEVIKTCISIADFYPFLQRMRLARTFSCTTSRRWWRTSAGTLDSSLASAPYRPTTPLSRRGQGS